MGFPRRSAPRPADEVRSLVRRELLRFAVPAVVGVVLLGLASLALAVAIAREESLGDASQNAQWLAGSVVQPHLTEGLVAGRTADIVAMDRAFDTTVSGSEVEDARLWAADGTIVYSDDPRLMGETFPQNLPAGAEPVPLDHSRSENRYLDPATGFVQVVLPVRGADGEPYTFQMIQRQDSVQQNARQIWWTFVPILLGTLLLVGTLLLLLAMRMARRLSRALRVRQDLLQHAVDASDLERRRISADLHDGTVQRLAGVGYTLSGLAKRSARSGDQPESVALGSAADQVQDSVRDLRSLLVDIYPPNIERTGLHVALSDVVAASGAGDAVELDVPELPDLDPTLRAVVYRVAREAILNAARHAHAGRIQVCLERTDDSVVMRVTDDGRGFDPAAVPEGHMGLRILSDLAESIGATLTVTSAPGHGTTVELRAR